MWQSELPSVILCYESDESRVIGDSEGRAIKSPKKTTENISLWPGIVQLV